MIGIFWMWGNFWKTGAVLRRIRDFQVCDKISHTRIKTWAWIQDKQDKQDAKQFQSISKQNLFNLQTFQFAASIRSIDRVFNTHEQTIYYIWSD